LGSIAGSALGGFLAQPARFYPHYFSKDGLFGQYPYLLPNLVSVIVIVIAIVQGVFLLEETNIRSPAPTPQENRSPSRGPRHRFSHSHLKPNGFDAATETTSLLHEPRRMTSRAQLGHDHLGDNGSSREPRRITSRAQLGHDVFSDAGSMHREPRRITSRALLQPTYDHVGENGSIYRTSTRHRRSSIASAFSNAPGGITYAVESLPMPMNPAFDLRRGSLASLGSISLKHKPSLIRFASPHPHVESAMVEDDFEEGTLEPKSGRTFNRGVIMWTVALIFQSYHSMGFYAGLPVWFLDDPRKAPPQLDLVGGLGITLHEVGTFLAISSFMSLFFQGLVFTFFVSRIGVWRALAIVTILYPIIYFAIPFISLLPDPNVGVYPLMALSSFTGVVSFPTLLILLKNEVPSPLVLGQVNGLAMSACSAARTVAPPLFGVFYSAFGSAGAWWSCGVVATIGIAQFFWTPRPKAAEDEIIMKAETEAIDAFEIPSPVEEMSEPEPSVNGSESEL
jgi:hypothetical protein